MTTEQWILVILTIFPLLWNLCKPLGEMLLQRLPARQQQALIDFPDMAVRKVEQKSQGLSNTDKKEAALNLTTLLFKTFKVPLPPEEILSGAIEAAVNMLPPTNKPAKE